MLQMTRRAWIPALALILSLLTGPVATAAESVPLFTNTVVEKVRYKGGVTSSRPPFYPLVVGDSVFVRVEAHTGSLALPAGAARIRLLLPDDLADAEIQVVDRLRVRRCVRIDRVVVSCAAVRVPPEQKASMLVRVEIPAGIEAATLTFRGSAVAVGNSTIKANRSTARIATVGRGPWSGTWNWHAEWDGGQFDGSGMQIYQPRDEAARVVCARWEWSNGGVAWGAVNRRGVWVAEWRDGYGKGTWTLDLKGDGSFSGRQVVDAYAPEAEDFTATIAGEWAGAATALDCDAIRQQVRGATAP